MTAFSAPFCAVDIYTFENGKYSFLASQGNSSVLSCTTTQLIQGQGELFSVTLAPGGPNGIAASPSWTEVLTPMSLVVIAMQRGEYSNVVMVGILETITENQSWTSNNPVRTITIRGCGFSYFFNEFTFSALSFMAGNALAPLGAVGAANLGLGYLLAFGLNAATPKQIAEIFYSGVMMASGGLMGKTRVPYQTTNIGLSGAIGVRFDDYPYGLIVPSSANFMSEDSSWMTKFREVLEFPIYECWVGTGPSGIWGATEASSGGLQFYSSLLPSAIPGIPQIIGRINPQPSLVLSSLSEQASFATIGGLSLDQVSPYIWSGVDTSRFKALSGYSLANSGFIQSSIMFSPNGVRNFYYLNPFGSNLLYGGNPTNTSILQFEYGMLADPASIHRYGYKPYPFNCLWFCNFGNTGIDQEQGPFQALVADANTRLASYVEPLPLMANGSISMELRPDIFIGNLFTYAPFRNQTDTWTFYINSVTHSWSFGGNSTTTLGLERGLPTTVYSNSDLMYNILQGNAQKLNGVYVSGLPSGLGVPLVPYELSNQRQFLSDIAQGYVSPQFN